jgi:phosphomannomutase
LLVAELAATLRAEGRTLVDRLDEIARAYGLHATDQLSVRVTDLSRIADVMALLRADPPDRLGGLAVDEVDDLSQGGSGLPRTEGLRFRLAEGARVVVRPSGTEPKLKCYLEVVLPVEDRAGQDGTGSPGGDQDTGAVDAARIAAAGRLDAIRADLSAAAGL